MPKKFPKLRGRMVEKFGSIEGFSKASGVPKATVYGKLTGHSNINKDDMVKWGKILDIPVGEFFDYYF